MSNAADAKIFLAFSLDFLKLPMPSKSGPNQARGSTSSVALANSNRGTAAEPRANRLPHQDEDDEDDEGDLAQVCYQFKSSSTWDASDFKQSAPYSSFERIGAVQACDFSILLIDWTCSATVALCVKFTPKHMFILTDSLFFKILLRYSVWSQERSLVIPANLFMHCVYLEFLPQ